MRPDGIHRPAIGPGPLTSTAELLHTYSRGKP
jgi:hypothetical protein